MAGGIKIATLGSHTALQILKGAKDEGFKTIAICVKGTEEPYKSFGVADEIILVDSFKEVTKLEKTLLKKNAVLIPHGSFIAHFGIQEVMDLKVPYFGNKKILEWESDRDMERKWLRAAGIRMPKIFKAAKDIDRSVIVKFHGAKGGKGYFVANSPKDFRTKIKEHKNKQYQLQEYIIGVPVYIHYFYSPITDELEILGFDKRYESNVDSIGRISARDQFALQSIDPSYVVVGNVPIVLRESLLPKAFEMGRAVIEQSKKIASPGLFGPFCLECVITPEQEFYVFEISARIVAGTNPYIRGSPYSQLKYKEPMSTGRRIAREIKLAQKKKKLDMVLDR